MSIDLAVAIAAALVLLVAPGLLLVRRREWETEGPLEVLATISLGSVAVWATLVWFVPRGLLTETALVVVLATLGGSVLRSRRRRASGASGPAGRLDHRIVFAALALAVVARLAIVVVRAPPSGGDLTMHAYMTELLVLNNGLPATHEPLLPVSSYGQNSPGLHTMAALVRIASGVPAHTAALLIGALALVALSLAIDRVVRTVWPAAPPGPRALAALATVFIARNPQMYVAWGGVPTILSQALTFYLMAECLALRSARDPLRSLRAGLIAAGAILTHLIPVLTFTYVLAGIALLALVRRRAGLAWGGALANAAVAVPVAGLLTARFLRLRSLSVDETTVEWARDWIRLELARSHAVVERLAGSLDVPPDLLWYPTLPIHVFVFLGFIATGAMAAWLVLRLFRRAGPVGFGWAVVGTLVALHVASIGEFIPYWMGLYPNRIHLFLLLPVAVALTDAFIHLSRRKILASALVVATAAGLVLESGRMGPDGDASHGGVFLDALVRTCSDTMNSRVTPDDLVVFEWIRSHTEPGDVFVNNPGDGGPLIPALCHRMITNPHYQQFWYREEMERWLADIRPAWLFIGAAPSPAYPRPHDPETVGARTDLELAFRSGEARLYRFVAPAPGQPWTP